MIGLLKKDFYITQNRKLFLGMFVIAMFLAPSTSVAFNSYFAVALSLSTIAYDDHNNSVVYLMTLPITRKDYVLSKYLLSLITCVVIGGLTLIIVSTVQLFMGGLTLALVTISQLFTGDTFLIGEWLLESVILIISPLLLSSIVIPINFKFGAEKGRLFLIFAFLIIGFFGNAAFNVLSTGGGLMLIEQISTIHPFILLLVFCLIIFVCVLISITISMRIIKNKEY